MQIEVNAKFINKQPVLSDGNTTMLLTPPINKDYWLLRVPVSDTQAIVAFPKFGTVGVGFQIGEDWNTNLPYTCDADEIFDHIAPGTHRTASAESQPPHTIISP